MLLSFSSKRQRFILDALVCLLFGVGLGNESAVNLGPCISSGQCQLLPAVSKAETWTGASPGQIAAASSIDLGLFPKISCTISQEMNAHARTDVATFRY